MVFNGDFVDRGSWSTEVVLTLFAYKWLYPKNVYLNRGNHETSDMNKVYGFEGETKKKYSELTYKLFEETFYALPIATLVTASQKPRELARRDTRLPINPFLSPEGYKRFFIVHGGLYSKDGVSLADVKKIDRIRQRQPGTAGLMSESLWADPQDLPGRGASKRGVGLGFGPDITRKFLEFNGVSGVIRSHEVRQAGYSIEHGGQCITVFSAPNYVDQVGNLAGILRIDDAGNITFTTFSAQPHPDIKPMACKSTRQVGIQS
ncbi:Palmitoyl-protein thioesterase 1 [Cystobasidiomycetes sp. EMM_F5]